MAKEDTQRAGAQGAREYPTEWTWYPTGAEDDDSQEEQVEGRNVERDGAAEKPDDPVGMNWAR